jgi:excisionase family DNA binding protein
VLIELWEKVMVHLENAALIQHKIEMDLAESKLRSLKIKRWLKTDEVALYLGSTREAVKKLYQRGKISANKLSGRLYFDREQLDLLLENSATGNAPVYSRQAVKIPAPRRR